MISITKSESVFILLTRGSAAPGELNDTHRVTHHCGGILMTLSHK